MPDPLIQRGVVFAAAEERHVGVKRLPGGGPTVGTTLGFVAEAEFAHELEERAGVGRNFGPQDFDRDGIEGGAHQGTTERGLVGELAVEEQEVTAGVQKRDELVQEQDAH